MFHSPIPAPVPAETPQQQADRLLAAWIDGIAEEASRDPNAPRVILAHRAALRLPEAR